MTMLSDYATLIDRRRRERADRATRERLRDWSDRAHEARQRRERLDALRRRLDGLREQRDETVRAYGSRLRLEVWTAQRALRAARDRGDAPAVEEAEAVLAIVQGAADREAALADHVAALTARPPARTDPRTLEAEAGADPRAAYARQHGEE
jgi:hypothetical protein